MPSSSSSSSTANADDIGAPKYAVCSGQGGNAQQLSPAFLDRMASCQASDTGPVDSLWEAAKDGEIIPSKGDCQFDHGISCHFHTSMEFVASTKLKDDEHAVGEMHCIVPSAHGNSPTVYGAHVRCHAGTSPESGTKACSKELVELLDNNHCHDGWRCCDNGTLTKPVGKQSPAELKLRPDFRICQDDAVEVDCGLFHNMHGHTANVAALGEEITGRFNALEHGPGSFTTTSTTTSRCARGSSRCKADRPPAGKRKGVRRNERNPAVRREMSAPQQPQPAAR